MICPLQECQNYRMENLNEWSSSRESLKSHRMENIASVAWVDFAKVVLAKFLGHCTVLFFSSDYGATVPSIFRLWGHCTQPLQTMGPLYPASSDYGATAPSLFRLWGHCTQPLQTMGPLHPASSDYGATAPSLFRQSPL